jgi:predicted LPLAT superfamily acyltransferase
MTGDMVWTEDQKTVTVRFLNGTATLPETPFMLSLLSGKPLFIMFSITQAEHRLKVTLSEPIYVQAASRKERKQAVQDTAQDYADRITEIIRSYPFEWFHFEPFLK